MKIALDAMGGDHAPSVTIEGALAAVDELGSGLSVILVGPEKLLQDEIARLGREHETRIEIADAPEVISMYDKAGHAIRQKRDSSLLRAIELHKNQEADAVVSAGHTGAQMAASYLTLGLIEGVRRPTIATLLPVGGGRFCVLLDVGANTDCKPIHLQQFAVMGSVFMQILTGIENPRVALLSIGEEKTKGNELVLATHYLLEESGLNFIGNLEGGDVLAGKADVLVCDGFVGNLILKFAESIGAMFIERLKSIHCDDAQILSGMKQLRKEMDYAEIGGVPLLGVNGISIICHGRSSAKAIKNAIREAVTLKKGDLPAALSRGMEQYEVGMFTRGRARFRSFREKHDELEGSDDNND
ncbi:phosphate acyltransferase PlsX [candidate division KSB1 bacterium]|nr:MAG: phosphate acyltransferase PlsX [candidate division KSB1 bacterium]